MEQENSSKTFLKASSLKGYPSQENLEDPDTSKSQCIETTVIQDSKPFYRVGEVSQLVDVDSYVLRYWEKMFPQLKPCKDETGQRIYTRSDIDTVLRIKSLLYEERYTIAGAKKKLNEESDNKGSIDNQRLLKVLRNVRNALQEISVILEKEV